MTFKIIFTTIIASILFSCSKRESAEPVAESQPEEKSVVSLTEAQFAAAGIEVGALQERMMSNTVNVTGMLDVPPQNLHNITAPFGGFLRATTLLQGMHVTRGQVIATVENPEYIQLQQDFLETKSQVEFLEAEYQRQLELAKENVNAQKTLQKSAADLAAMKARNSGLKAKLQMLNITASNLTPSSLRSSIELFSPINGYVTQVNGAIGGFVSPTDVLFRIVDTDHLHAELIAFERDVPKIKIGQTIRFNLVNEQRERTAKVYLIGREISKDRTVRIHGHLDKEDRDLIPGMYLNAVIETGGQSLLSLPEDAVLHYENKDFVFLQTVGSHYDFSFTEVKTGVRDGGFVEITFPSLTMTNDQRVVVKGGYKLLSKLKNDELGEESGH